MASEWDNEIDFLLRRAGQNIDDTADFAEGITHLDADDLSAFAENVVPESLRLNIVSHLADCNSCRQVLSNLILLNEAVPENEAVIASESQKTVVTAKPSWLDSFKKIFAFPTLGYATAALAVLLVSSFAVIVWRGIQKTDAVLVAQVEQEQIQTQKSKNRPAVSPQSAAKSEENELKPDEDTLVQTQESNSEVSVENTPAPVETDAKSLPPSVSATLGNSRNSSSSSASANSLARNEALAANSSITSSAANAAAAPKPPSPATAAEDAAKPEALGSTASRSAAPKQEEKAKADLIKRANNTELKADDEAGSLELAPSGSGKQASSVESGLNKKVVVETRTVGGKTFQKIGVVWFDLAYNSQTATDISRGSDEYQKLNSGLRSIANNLSGKIIVIWQGKAYRIH